jgi:hypothetical protein
MKPIYEYIASLMIGSKYHFKCGCLIALDVEGEVVDWSMSGQELILHVQVQQKIVKIGLNHPHLTIEKL